MDTIAFLRGCGIRHSLTVPVEENFYYGCRNVNVKDWINGAVRFGGGPRTAVMKLRKETLKSLVIAILSVNLLLLFFTPGICTAEPVTRLEYNWVNKNFDSTTLVEYNFSNLPTDTLKMVTEDFKETPYIVKLDSHEVENKFSDIEIEKAWISSENNKIYLLFSIVWVSDIYVVYELDNFEIHAKYTTSAWSLKKQIFIK